MDGLDRTSDLLGPRVLGQVAAGAGAQRGEDGLVVGVGGEHDHADGRVLVADHPGRLDPVHVWHAEVDEHHVHVVLRQQVEQLSAVVDRSDELDLGKKTEDRGEALAHDPLIVRQGDADAHASPPVMGTVISTQKPEAFGANRTSPPASSARSAMPASP